MRIGLSVLLLAPSVASAQPAPEPPPPEPPPPVEAAPAQPPPPEAPPVVENAPPPPPPVAPPVAAAAPPPPQPVVAAPPPVVPPPEPEGVRTHDGWYIRASLGAGRLWSSIDYAGSDVSVFGGGLEIDFALGGTVGQGIAIGGGAIAQGTENTKVTTSAETDAIVGQPTLVLLGPMIDWFFDVHGGLHAGALLGIASFRFLEDREVDPSDGWGLSIEAGWDFWVGRQWSLGGLARYTAGFTLHDAAADPHSSETTNAIAIAFTALCH